MYAHFVLGAILAHMMKGFGMLNQLCVCLCLSRDSVSGRGGQDQLCARVPSSEGRGWRGSPARPPQDPRGHNRTGPWYVLTYVLCQVY